jgi:hypothetical protein
MFYIPLIRANVIKCITSIYFNMGKFKKKIAFTNKYSLCSGVLLEKLTGPYIVRKFAAFYGNRAFITAFTGPSNYPYLEPDQSSPCPYPVSWKTHFNIILPSAPRFSKWPLSLRFPYQASVCISLFPHTCYMPCPSQS